MYKFIHNEPFDKFSVTVEVDHITIGDIVESFKDFLRGCSFSNELVDRIKYNDDDDDCECCKKTTPPLSPFAAAYIDRILQTMDDGK